VDGLDSFNLQTQITANTNDISNIQTNKQDSLTAGENISIIDNVISSTGGGSSTNGFIGFRVETIGNINVDVPSGERIPFNSKNNLFLYDTENAYNTSTYGYTVNFSGYWNFQVNIFVVTSVTTNSRLNLTVRRNNINYSPCNTGQYVTNSSTINTTIPLLIGDEVFVSPSINTIRIFKSDDNCWFNGQFLGAI
jgi:hypothetical protein